VKNKTHRLNIRVENQLYRLVLKEANAKCLSVSDVIRLAIIKMYGRGE
jgi:uncharacterized protein (DUF1778 family)